MRQSGAFFGFLKRASTSEHDTAGDNGPAFSVRSWSSSLIAAMRRFRTGNLDMAIAPEKIDRSAPSLTDSDSVHSASVATW
jgi:hypothetical protein